jgi:hypothetical protein
MGEGLKPWWDPCSEQVKMKRKLISGVSGRDPIPRPSQQNSEHCHLCPPCKCVTENRLTQQVLRECCVASVRNLHAEVGPQTEHVAMMRETRNASRISTVNMNGNVHFTMMESYSWLARVVKKRKGRFFLLITYRRNPGQKWSTFLNEISRSKHRSWEGTESLAESITAYLWWNI